MDRYSYNCKYCGKNYIPRRRFKQKYCSNSCRVNAFNLRNKLKKKLPQVMEEVPISKTNKMSLSGIGNAAIGTLATNVVTSLLTKEENKPATKGDIQKLINSGLNKIILVKNLPPLMDGSKAYFNTIDHTLIYKK